MSWSLSEIELEFLAAHIKPTDRVWEFGTGKSTVFLAERCKRLTSVEHQAAFAAKAVEEARPNQSVLYIPPNLPYVEGGEDDGDRATFYDYVTAYQGRGVDVVLVDGRARVACAHQIAELAPFGPEPGLLVFVHDIDREQYLSIWDPARAGNSLSATVGHFREITRVERLMLCGVKT